MSHWQPNLMDSKLTSIVLPAYNEKKNILQLIHDLPRILEGKKIEILVVDDNSPDGTYQAVLDLNLPYVRAILRKEDKGLAQSIGCGIQNASGEIIVVMDSDYNHDPRYLPFMLSSLEYYDCVTASRFQYGGGMENAHRTICSWIFNIFVRVATGGMVTDSLYGYFAIRKNVLSDIDFKQTFCGYGDYFIRLMYFLQKKRISILQFPAINGARMHGQGNSQFFGVLIKYTLAVLKLVWNERILNKHELRLTATVRTGGIVAKR